MQFLDAVTVGGTRLTKDGYLVAMARVARIGIQDYLGTEVDPDNELGLRDKPFVRIYRPEASVFHKDAFASYAHRPMTNDHPGGDGVNSKNWKDVAVGNTGGEVVRDGDFVAVPLVIMDQAAIDDYHAGKRQLSMGLEAELIVQDGQTPQGEQYDAYLGPMSMNHVALVDSARGGNQLRIGDRRAAPASLPARHNPTGGHDMADTRKILVDGLSIETTEQGAQVVEKLQRQLTDAAAATKTLTDTHATVLAGKDADLAKKDAEIDGLKAKVMTDAALDALVLARSDLVATATAIADGDYKGKTEAEIRKAAVVAKLGDAAVKDKPDAYIAARFDILAEDAVKDPVRQHMQDGHGRPTPQDNGQSAYETRLSGSWKTTTKGA